jgi:DNA-binding NtrC family response regulator
MITAYGDIDMAVNAMKNGAHDFFQKPIELEELEKSIERAGEVVAMRRELAHLRQSQYSDLDFVKGKSPEMEDLLDQAKRAADASVSVLITGETGTGKEILVNAIHKMIVEQYKKPCLNPKYLDMNRDHSQEQINANMV